MSPNLPKPAKPAPTASPAPSPAAGSMLASETTAASDNPSTAAVPSTPPADRGDLGRGSLTRKLAAGERTLVIDYWTDADPATLTAASPTVIKVSAHIENGDAEHAVKVSRFLATFDDGQALTTMSDDRGEFVLTPPYSYGTALTLRPTNPTAQSVTVSVQFDLLIETAPGSGSYFRQTVLDNVRIAFPTRGAAS